MIFMLAGTSDARSLALKLQKANYDVTATVVTESAAASLAEVGLKHLVGRLTADQMATILTEQGYQLVVDASHPFAEEASKNAMTAAEIANIPYIRYERAQEHYTHPLITVVKDYEEAAHLAAKKRGVIMLTTGSKTLSTFTKVLHGLENTRLIARMLPRLDNMEKCDALGVAQKDIVAIQGPFSKELNEALFRQYGVTLMITKESGKVGSVDEKLEAALACNIETILIARPNIKYGQQYSTFDEIVQAVTITLGGNTNGL